MYDHVCPGSDNIMQPLPGTGCNGILFKQNWKQTNTSGGGLEYWAAEYTILILGPPPPDKAAALLKFSQNITNPDIDMTVSTPSSLTYTEIDTLLLLTVPLSTVDTDNFVTLTIQSSNNAFPPCLLSATCDYCDDCDTVVEVMLNEMMVIDNYTDYGTTVEYTCPLGQQFVNGTGENFKTHKVHCEWDQTWHPSTIFPQCEGNKTYNFREKLTTIYSSTVTACINPPVPPNDTYLTGDYLNVTETPLGENISYWCQSGHYFDHDFDLQSFNLTCFENGTWEHPNPWLTCVHPSSNDYFQG